MQLNDELLAQFRSKLQIDEVEFNNLVNEAAYDAEQFANLCIKNRLLARYDAGMLLGNHFNCAYIDLEKTLFQPDIVVKLPQDIAQKYHAIPVYQFGSSITLVMANPSHKFAQREIEKILGEVDFLFSFKDEIDTAIAVYYQDNKAIHDVFKAFDLGILDRITDEKSSELSEVVTISNSIIMLALKDGASDIHIEPKEHSCIIRFRSDGILKNRFTLPHTISRVLVSRYKVIANLDISERRKPQDGRISFATSLKKIDIRVSTLPSIHGETMVMRLLGSLFGSVSLDLEKLNISPEIHTAFTDVLAKPNGLILVTGPTGSGKSTTLYAALNHIDSPESKILTVEDPVEYEMFNFTQTQVNVKAGRTFSAILKSVLRQDPDVILVGEIRDSETANIAAEAALTGHIVLSTLHTNNALQAVTRLSEMGVAPYVIAPSLSGVLAQRLPRRVCQDCKEKVQAKAEDLQLYFSWTIGTKLPMIYRAKGCTKCGGTGYKGRVGIHEYLHIDLNFREMIIQGKSYNEIRTYALAHGYRDMRFDGFRKALQGLTTIEEIVRVTASD